MAAPRTDITAPVAPPAARLADVPLYQRVAERLRERIVAHSMAPGSWIDEQALTGELGISRTPLREALKVLAAEGLVTMKPRRGAYVTEVSERDLSEVFHLLALLESDAAAVVAAQGSDEQLAELAALHGQLEATVAERDAFFAANERFHMRLLEIADNRWRNQMVADLRKVMKLYRHHSLFKQGRLEASLKEHRKIMAALKARDADKVRELMQQHLAQGKDAASQR
ncbi:GntR family transcriptional regulator [Piscinibacter terrae]|uniref:GntR family transcriptional regulator n=1 Tax=Piscinibacter terrae TaxID=2496871 RepID=A0A3N7HWU0_9BURK|nr:GntR family transcriptional regulator [Albitalea terrae]RQP25896.1 GntR family transcriptional regulator [Albitalea terrae]